MPTRLRVLQLVLGLVACLLALGAVRELGAARPLPSPPAPRPARPAPATAPAADPPVPEGYDVIAARNLFNPSRTEASAAGVVAAVSKLTLHGVVMDGARSRAYLEDPGQPRTFAYAVGDPAVGGRVASIATDRVVIVRGDGAVEVLLRDPAKPRPAAPPAPGTPVAVPVPAPPAATSAGPRRQPEDPAGARAARMDR